MVSTVSSSETPGLHVQRVGHGPDLVLLHGWGMHGGVWEDVVEALMDDYRITLPDLPGHGHSRHVSGAGDLDDLTRRVLAVAPRHAVWVGWSLGGLVALRAALTDPGRVQRLVLVASSPCFVRRPGWPCAMEPQVLGQFAEGLCRDYRGTLQRFLALEVHGGAQAREQLRALKALVFQHGEPDPKALARGLELLERTDLREELPRITCPVLWLLGRRDTLVPHSLAERLREHLPRARVHVLRQAAHAPFLSHPDTFIQQLTGFLHG